MSVDTTDPEKVNRVLARLRAVLAGDEPDPTYTCVRMLEEMGKEALACFHEAFQIKMVGGTDAAGIHWKDLAETTKAYSRQPGPRKKMGERPRGLLSVAQDARWRSVYWSAFHRYRTQGAADRDASGHAAAVAWHVLKLEGAPTMLEHFGQRQLPILFNTGDLLASLDPEGNSNNQILHVDLKKMSVRVGSSLPHANAHHKGNKARGLPARKLWPERLPKVWQDRITFVMEVWVPILLDRLWRITP